MKKALAMMALVAMAITAQGQGLNVQSGSVVYNYAAEGLGDIDVTTSALTIGGTTYDVSGLTAMTVVSEVMDDNTVTVSYDGEAATVYVAGNLAELLEVAVTGAHVALLQSAAVADEITYTLEGESSNGSLYMDGAYKASFVLNGVTLHNPDSCAINIQDGKRIDMKVTAGTTNVLSDGLTTVSDDGTDAHKAALYVQGHTELTGAGTLTITGNVKNGFSSHEYLLLKKKAGTINITSNVKDALSVGEYFNQLGGTVTLLATGDGGRALNVDEYVLMEGGYLEGVTIGGILAENTDDERKPHALAADGNIELAGGEMYFASMSNKAFKSDLEFLINGGTLMGIGGKKSDTPSSSSTQAYATYTKQSIAAGATAEYDGVTFTVPSSFALSSANVIVSGGN